MNRKQKKAKRLKAQAHTKNQAQSWKKYDTPCSDVDVVKAEPIIMNRQQAEACLNRRDDFCTAVRDAAKSKVKCGRSKAINTLIVFCILFIGWCVWSTK